MDRFSQLLYDLGLEIGEKLYPDRNRICKINYRHLLHVQLEFNDSKEQLLIALFLCDVPPGKYRETLLKEALKANDEFPRIGILSYSDRNNQLALHDNLDAQHLTGPKLFQFLEAFLKKGLAWKEAVEKGLPLPSPQAGPTGGSIFGLK